MMFLILAQTCLTSHGVTIKQNKNFHLPTLALIHRVKTSLTGNNVILHYKRKKIKRNIITHHCRGTRKSCYEEKKENET